MDDITRLAEQIREYAQSHEDTEFVPAERFSIPVKTFGEDAAPAVSPGGLAHAGMLIVFIVSHDDIGGFAAARMLAPAGDDPISCEWQGGEYHATGREIAFMYDDEDPVAFIHMAADRMRR
ncbi:hypothetical protein [Bifidobacterium sp. SO1]|uniref:hypothetical protein n=1 Tax=Bifidobacterium sp. SO1 TaxID=2809029 RepID=UPI001BDD05F5|nr:hypothetical protein [Bifidobacterium sp. SO1]MBT1162798.1 hypothetical protein [Bifidobacterium sp. SO1]